jgi:TonB family protein
MAKAQDVIVTAPSWTYDTEPPNELPKFRHTPRIDYPAELRGTSEFAYVVNEIVLDERGRVLGTHSYATHAPLTRSDVDESPRFSPARRNGKSVTSAITYAAICNPASARPKGPDASPRLLEVALVRDDTAPTKHAATPGERVVYASVEVGMDGTVVGIADPPEGLRAAFLTAARRWKFAPARHGGVATAAKVQVPFIVVPAHAFPEDGLVPPRVIRRERPEYPYALSNSGMRGEVTVDLIVDIEGRPRNVFAEQSLNPSFDDAAVEAVRRWRFEPARVHGTPLPARFRVSIVFELEDVPNGGSNGIQRVRAANLEKLPPELRYDVAPTIRAYARPVFPWEALVAHRTGSATATFLVDERGEVSAAAVSSATSPEFGKALLAAVDLFHYEPALKAGRPNKSVVSYHEDFSLRPGIGPISEEDEALVRRELSSPATILAWAQLDASPEQISRRPAVFPHGGLPKNCSEGSATIEFLIDEEGRVRLPRIVTATEPAFGYAAVQAASRWRYEPPKRAGRPVIVRGRETIHFKRQ